MTKSKDVVRFIKGSLVVGVVLISYFMLNSEEGLVVSNLTILGGASAIGLFVFCRIMERFVDMVDDI